MKGWTDYLASLDEFAGLESREAGGHAEVNDRYQHSVRSAKNRRDSSDRDLHQLKQRNSKLQVEIRGLCREVGASASAGGAVQTIRPGELDEAIRSAEYDLKQLRQSFQYLQSQEREAALGPRTQRTQPVQNVENSPEVPSPRRSTGLVWSLAAGAAVVIVILIALLK